MGEKKDWMLSLFNRSRNISGTVRYSTTKSKPNVLYLQAWCLSEDGKCPEQHDEKDTWNIIQEQVKESEVIVFSKSYCPYCKKVKELFDKENIPYTLVELDKNSHGEEIQGLLRGKIGQKTVPAVFVQGMKIGGSSDTMEAWE